MLLTEMTSPEVDTLPRDIVVVAPTASCEQHSLHLPVFTDSFIGEEIARRVHERIPEDVLVLPVQWLGFSQHHLRYAGTVTALSETHLMLMMDMVSSIVAHGFRKILLLNSHGGNRSGIQVLLQRLLERYQDEEAEFYTRWAWAGPDVLNEIRDLGDSGSGHAGETETSMMMVIRPDLVREERFDADGQREGVRVGDDVSSYYRLDQVTAHGGIGDPRSATAAKGERMLAASALEVAEQVLQIRKLRPFAK